MNWKKNLLSFLLGLSGVFMKAQNPVSFTSDQGLSNTCIRSIMEDSRKNEWISTQSGLNRYDCVKMNVGSGTRCCAYRNGVRRADVLL